jgi:uncharacterized membrane protein
MYEALQKLDASKFTVLFSCRALITILTASFFLKEGLTFPQVLGTVLILLSIVLVNLQKLQFTFGKQEGYSILAAICFGVATTNDRTILQVYPLYTYVFLAFVLPSILLFATHPRIYKELGTFFSKSMLLKFGLLGVMFAASSLTFFRALQITTNSSLLVSANLTSVILTVALSVLFLHEKQDIPKKFIGAALSFMGLLLLQ